METEEKPEVRKDLTQSWSELVFENLKNLEQREKLMFEGCSSLLEYIDYLPNHQHLLTEIKLKNMSLMITDFKIIFASVKEIIAKTKFEVMNKELDEIISIKQDGKKPQAKSKDLTDIIKAKLGKIEYIAENHSDNVGRKISWKILTPLFTKIANRLSDLRKELISNLSHILHSVEQKKKRSGEV